MMNFITTLGFAVASALFFGLAFGIDTFFTAMGWICLFSALGAGFVMFLKYLDGAYD